MPIKSSKFVSYKSSCSLLIIYEDKFKKDNVIDNQNVINKYQNPEDVFWTSIRTKTPGIQQTIHHCREVFLYKITQF